MIEDSKKYTNPEAEIIELPDIDTLVISEPNIPEDDD